MPLTRQRLLQIQLTRQFPGHPRWQRTTGTMDSRSALQTEVSDRRRQSGRKDTHRVRAVDLMLGRATGAWKGASLFSMVDRRRESLAAMLPLR
jgi:hypothetical protein